MPSKTITVTEDAYEALKRMKNEHESFSKTILRVSKRKPLREFYGVLSPESAGRMEKIIHEMRNQRNAAHRKRLEKIKEAFQR